MSNTASPSPSDRPLARSDSSWPPFLQRRHLREVNGWSNFPVGLAFSVSQQSQPTASPGQVELTDRRRDHGPLPRARSECT